jgi:hypothetical protein
MDQEEEYVSLINNYLIFYKEEINKVDNMFSDIDENDI